MGIAAVALGVAQGALDDVVELAATKMPLLAAQPLATNSQFCCLSSELRIFPDGAFRAGRPASSAMMRG
jgi:hypothetical protein